MVKSCGVSASGALGQPGLAKGKDAIQEWWHGCHRGIYDLAEHHKGLAKRVVSRVELFPMSPGPVCESCNLQ